MKKIDGWYWPDGDEKSHKARYQEMLSALDETLALVDKQGACIQAGGAVGIWPQYLSQRFDEVYTFEPDEQQFECLSHNVKANNVHAYRAALGESPGYVGTVHHQDRCNASHVDDGGSGVPRILLDSIAVKTPVAFVCLDCEGYELFALRGGEDVLIRDKPVVQVEDKHGDRFGVGPNDIDDYMNSLGYTLHSEYKFDKVFV